MVKVMTISKSAAVHLSSEVDGNAGRQVWLKGVCFRTDTPELDTPEQALGPQPPTSSSWLAELGLSSPGEAKLTAHFPTQ